MPVRQLTEEENKYVQGVVEKFNANKEDPDLTDVEKTLLSKLVEAETEAAKLTEEANTVVEEVKKKQESLFELNPRIANARSQ